MTLATYDNFEQFAPSWVSAPGDTIKDRLKDYDLSLKEFAEMLDKPLPYISRLIRGHEIIDESLAYLLEESLGSSAEFWLNREKQYRADATRLKKHRTISDEEKWLKDLPLADMKKFGWVDFPRSNDERITACLDYFGVANLEAWQNKYQSAIETAAFRTSETFDSNIMSVAAWYRQGQIIAENAASKTRPWDLKRFKAELTNIRKLTRKKDPKTFIPELVQICRECGVSLAIVRSPKGCRASGVASFISERQVMIILSVRYLSDDQFWFTFFHEAAHLILHKSRSIYIDDKAPFDLNVDKEEREANEFAGDILIPKKFQERLKTLDLDKRNVARTSKEIGVSSGILIGQMQHKGLIPKDQKNWFKKRFTWDDLNEAIKAIP